MENKGPAFWRWTNMQERGWLKITWASLFCIHG